MRKDDDKSTGPLSIEIIRKMWALSTTRSYQRRCCVIWIAPCKVETRVDICKEKLLDGGLKRSDVSLVDAAEKRKSSYNWKKSGYQALKSKYEKIYEGSFQVDSRSYCRLRRYVLDSSNSPCTLMHGKSANIKMYY